MADGLLHAVSGMRQAAARLEIIGLNLANLLTPGYKRQTAASQAFHSVLAALNTQGDVTSRLESGVDFRPGALRATGNALDLAIEGDAFFEIIEEGRAVYTRQGNFVLDKTGRLQAPGGAALSGVSGDIRVDTPQPQIDAQGRVMDKDVQAGQIRLVRFDDPARLQPLSNGRFLQGWAQIIPADQGQPVQLRQGFLEASNVMAADEMVQLMATLRRFEHGRHAIQAYDDMNAQVLARLGEF